MDKFIRVSELKNYLKGLEESHKKLCANGEEPFSVKGARLISLFLESAINTGDLETVTAEDVCTVCKERYAEVPF